MTEKELIIKINDQILKDYDMRVDGFRKAESGCILATFSPCDKEITINKTSKQVFNDYIQFIETMLHENAHKINDSQGLIDVDMDGEKQVHNAFFRATMRDLCGIYCKSDEYTGGADMGEPKNAGALNRIIVKRIQHKKAFNEIRDIYFKDIYIEPEYEKNKKQDGSETDNENKNDGGQKEDGRAGGVYQDNGEKYSFEEEGGEEI